jgi:hypothetical protein
VEEHGVCGPIHTTLRETRLTVVVEIEEERRSGICITLAEVVRREVHLAEPLAGRAVRRRAGGTAVGDGCLIPGSTPCGVVPRLIGFAPQDAKYALSHTSLRLRTRSQRGTVGLRRVVAQDPAPGRKDPPNGLIRVAVGGS